MSENSSAGTTGRDVPAGIDLVRGRSPGEPMLRRSSSLERCFGDDDDDEESLESLNC